jgi:membrane-associated phospholipid phosphatase
MATALFGCVFGLISAPRAAWAQQSTGTGAVVVTAGARDPLGRDDPRPISWRWRRFDTADYAITGAALVVSLGTAVAPVPGWRWSGSLGVEDAARDALRVRTYAGRRTASDVSDVLLAATLTAPILFDALVTSWGRRGSSEVAKQLTLIDVETYAIVGAVTSLTSSLSARERPYGANGDCGTVLDPQNIDCEVSQRTRYRSFFSGHSSLAFAGAALVCTHHAHLGLYDGPGDAAACAAAMMAATATGTLRMVADRHYLGDVALGAAVGTALGFAVPWFHYRVASARDARDAAVMLVPNPSGATLSGTF